ncbi:MAG: M15 family metallopeptidase [Hydrogeniiclostridium sp.]
MSLQEWSVKPIPVSPEGENIPFSQECGDPLVDITQISPRIVYAASYYQQNLNGALSRCYVRKKVADLLLQALTLLPEGYSFQIFDTLRPVSVQQALYDAYMAELMRLHPDWDREKLNEEIDQFVALPRIDYRRPAPHTTGGAVDLTLCRGGAPLPMGTDFDDFSPRAGTGYLEKHQELPGDKEAAQNRRILYHCMLAAGFVNYSGEWWHFSYGDRAWAGKTGNIPIYSYVEPPAYSLRKGAVQE